ncbi:MAG: hypothetical protein HY293_02620, partial [Planctomycetes bacterium]|nr:hypothetical protein [Planctomycetota bacterium]
MITPLLLALALLQDETLLERLGSEQAAERGAAQQQLIRLGRGAYPLLRKALASEDVELKARARETAYAIGFDPDSHRPWEEVWAAYHQAPDAPTRRVLVRLSATVRDPRLTLLAKMERGVFRELPSCPSENAPRPPSPGAPEWDVLEEV